MDWLLQESKDSFMVLYRVERSGPVTVGQTRFFSRKGKEPSQGVFLSRQPEMIATMHGIQAGVGKSGGLHAYRIHKSITKQPDVVSDVFDEAWEIFIPKHVWNEYLEKGLIQYLGKSAKKVAAVHGINTAHRMRNRNMFFKKIETDLPSLKKFVEDNNLENNEISEILRRYYGGSKNQYIVMHLDSFDAINYAKALFIKHGIRFRQLRQPYTRNGGSITY